MKSKIKISISRFWITVSLLLLDTVAQGRYAMFKCIIAYQNAKLKWTRLRQIYEIFHWTTTNIHNSNVLGIFHSMIFKEHYAWIKRVQSDEEKLHVHIHNKRGYTYNENRIKSNLQTTEWYLINIKVVITTTQRSAYTDTIHLCNFWSGRNKHNIRDINR